MLFNQSQINWLAIQCADVSFSKVFPIFLIIGMLTLFAFFGQESDCVELDDFTAICSEIGRASDAYDLLMSSWPGCLLNMCRARLKLNR